MTTLDGLPVKPQQARGVGVSEVLLSSGEAWGIERMRVFVKRQSNYTCRPWWRLLRKTPTLRRELRGLQACCRLGIPVPPVVAYQERGGNAQLVLAEVPGALALNEALTQPGTDRLEILREVGRTIGHLHRAGWTHGALYPWHVLVRKGPYYRVTLIDLEKARRSIPRRRSDVQRFLRHAGLTSQQRSVFMESYRRARHAAT